MISLSSTVYMDLNLIFNKNNAESDTKFKIAEVIMHGQHMQVKDLYLPLFSLVVYK